MQGWTNLDNLAEAILAMASNLPRLKFLIVTLGASGCVMLEVAHQGLFGCTLFLSAVYEFQFQRNHLAPHFKT